MELPRPSLHLKSVLDRTEVHLGDIEIEPILSTPEHILQPIKYYRPLVEEVITAASSLVVVIGTSRAVISYFLSL